MLVATEAAGEGINLQCCHILFNYDIPWNPNRLEQRMGRIHRYGQRFDCLIFNFVAGNTIEGHVLQRLLGKLQEIRDALDDDAVFNVVGEVLPAAQVERVLRDFYAGRLGEADLEDRLLREVDEGRFREICQTALEGLASKKLNLEMLVERRARAQERRVVPETIARFMAESARNAAFTLNQVRGLPHTFEPGRTPTELRRYEREPDWNLSTLTPRYPRLSTDRDTAEERNLEWVTPGHPLFEALRRHSLELAQVPFAKGACFYSLDHDAPARLDFYRARVVDGLGQVIHERLFAVELADGRDPLFRQPDILGNLTPASTDGPLSVASLPEAGAWLNQNALTPFLNEVREQRVTELDRIAEHVELSLTEVLHRIDQEIGRAAEEVENQVVGAEGRLAQAESRHDEATARRDRRRRELTQQRALTLQSVERLTSILVLPHPDGDDPEVKRLKPNSETEMTAMQVVMDYEEAQGRQVKDVHEKNLGYDVTSLDTASGELRLIEVKGLAAKSGTILLSPNERRVAEDRRDCYWLYIVTNCANEPQLQEPVHDPASFPWHEVSKVQHYWLAVDTMTRPMRVREEPAEYQAVESSESTGKLTMTERNDLLISIADTIADYRAGEIPQRTPQDIEEWVGQFDASVQLPILREMSHVLKQTYLPKGNVEGFLSGLVVLEKLTRGDPQTFWRSAKLLDIQGGGSSQTEMLQLFEASLRDKCGLTLDQCSGSSGIFVYIDDGIFTGNRLRTDIGDWIREDAPEKAELNIIVIAMHRGGQYYARNELEKVAKASGKSIKTNWWRCIELEDRRTYTTMSDVLRPREIPDVSLVHEYVESLRYSPTLRTAGSLGENKFFSSEEGRHVLEQEFLKAGVAIRSQNSNLNVYQRPLGNSVLETLGFGSLLVTFRNCPNNCPLVLWVDQDHYPALFPRKTNSDSLADQVFF